MCDLDDDLSAIQRSDRRRARRNYRCYACDETIVAGDLHVYTFQVWDRGADTYRHCLRCWAMFDWLVHRLESSIQWNLNCGEVYEDPPDEVASLAFLTREEIQALPDTTWSNP